MSPDWRKTVSFTTRMLMSTRISDAYRAAHSEAANETAATARLLEQRAYANADSEADYGARVDEIVLELGSASSRDDSLEDAGETAEEVARRTISSCKALRRFGRYGGAAEFQHGLFTVCYVAQRLEDSLSETTHQCRYVAVKATTLAAVRPPHDAAREARIMLRAASEHVMPVLDHFRDGAGHFVLVMPFLPCTFEQVLQAEKRRCEALTAHESPYTVPKQVKWILRDVLRALAYIHSQSIIHRDVKPSNILMASANGPATLSDFGIAWSASDGASEPAKNKISDVGTTCYRAPEILFGYTAYSEKLDMWALGCLVGETLLAGSRTLFDAGETGSELPLIKSIFESLGTPTTDSWPEAAQVPSWGKIQFRDFKAKSWNDILPRAEPSGQDLVSKLVKYSESARLTAQESLEHPFLVDVD